MRATGQYGGRGNPGAAMGRSYNVVPCMARRPVYSSDSMTK